MGDLVVTEFISLDGVIEDPGGAEKDRFPNGGWSFKFDRGAEGDQFKMEELQAAEGQLLGRVTYEGFAAAWPKMASDPFVDKMNSMPKYVVSRSLQQPGWQNSTVLSGELAEEVNAIKERHAGDILVAGSASLVQSLTELGLVDEYRLMMFPVLLGGGKRMFRDDGELRNLKLVEHRPAGDTMILRYRTS
ncbi:MAG TPA: dihydrofolate reductase family protein [Pedococcus sp.]|jgi:dihydrofolate reductase|nr:dihydrofolate reductase family protein [Pedococcus sp.]